MSYMAWQGLGLEYVPNMPIGRIDNKHVLSTKQQRKTSYFKLLSTLTIHFFFA